MQGLKCVPFVLLGILILSYSDMNVRRERERGRQRGRERER